MWPPLSFKTTTYLKSGLLPGFCANTNEWLITVAAVALCNYWYSVWKWIDHDLGSSHVESKRFLADDVGSNNGRMIIHVSPPQLCWLSMWILWGTLCSCRALSVLGKLRISLESAVDLISQESNWKPCSHCHSDVHAAFEGNAATKLNSQGRWECINGFIVCICCLLFFLCVSI